MVNTGPRTRPVRVMALAISGLTQIRMALCGRKRWRLSWSFGHACQTCWTMLMIGRPYSLRSSTGIIARQSTPDRNRTSKSTSSSGPMTSWRDSFHGLDASQTEPAEKRTSAVWRPDDRTWLK